MFRAAVAASPGARQPARPAPRGGDPAERGRRRRPRGRGSAAPGSGIRTTAPQLRGGARRRASRAAAAAATAASPPPRATASSSAPERNGRAPRARRETRRRPRRRAGPGRRTGGSLREDARMERRRFRASSRLRDASRGSRPSQLTDTHGTFTLECTLASSLHRGKGAASSRLCLRGVCFPAFPAPERRSEGNRRNFSASSALETSPRVRKRRVRSSLATHASASSPADHVSEPGGSRRARRRARRRRARRRRRRRFGSRTGGRRGERRGVTPATLAARMSVRRSWTAPTTFAPAIAKKARGRHAFFRAFVLSVRSRFVRFEKILFVVGVTIETFETRKDAARKRLRGRRRRRRDVVGVDVIGVDAIVVRVVRVVRLAARARARVRVGFRRALAPIPTPKSLRILPARRSRIRSRSAPASRARASRRGARRRRGARPPRAETATPERGDRSRASFLRFESIARVERKLGRVARSRPPGGDHRASALASRDGDRLRVVRGSEPGDTERPQVRVLGEPTPNRAVARARERDVGAGGDFRRDRFRKRGKKRSLFRTLLGIFQGDAPGRVVALPELVHRARGVEHESVLFRRRDGDEDARKRLQRVSLLGRPLARSVRSFRSGSVRSARRRGFGATTKERLEHRGRLRRRYRRSVTGRRPERRRAALAFAGRHVLGKAELRVAECRARRCRCCRRARALARAQLSERVGPEREHLAARVTTALCRFAAATSIANASRSAPATRRGVRWYALVSTRRLWRTGRRRFGSPSAPRASYPSRSSAPRPQENTAPRRDRERGASPRRRGRRSVCEHAETERHGRAPTRGVAVVHFRVVHAEPPASAVPPATHRPVAQRHHRVELGGVERNNAAADAGEAIDAR